MSVANALSLFYALAIFFDHFLSRIVYAPLSKSVLYRLIKFKNNNGGSLNE